MHEETILTCSCPRHGSQASTDPAMAPPMKPLRHEEGTEKIWRSENVSRSFRPLVTAKGPKTTRSDTCWDGRSKKYRGPNISILLKLILTTNNLNKILKKIPPPDENILGHIFAYIQARPPA